MTMRNLENGKRLDRLVKDSLECTRYLIRRRFREQFPGGE